MYINKKGFTLIELLAVITIMGILLVVAIPAISRTIENSKKDKFLDTTKQYVNGVRTLWRNDELKCEDPDDIDPTDGIDYVLPSEAPVKIKATGGIAHYYVLIDTAATVDSDGESLVQILESGGKSSWSDLDVKGYVRIWTTAQLKLNFAIGLVDTRGHGIIGVRNYTMDKDRSAVKTNIKSRAEHEAAGTSCSPSNCSEVVYTPKEEYYKCIANN